MKGLINIFRTQKFNHLLNTVALFTGMLLLFLAVGYTLLGSVGLLWAAGLGMVSLVFSSRIPTAMIMRFQGGRALAPSQAPALTRLMRDISQRAGLPRMPQLYYIPSRALNAFATGTKQDPAVAVTYGLLQRLNLRELSGVLAHEVGHIVNNDIPLRSVVNLMDRLTRILSFVGKLMLFIYLPLFLMGGLAAPPWGGILLLILAPTISTLLTLAFSRTREFEADLTAAEIIQDPGALADALEKLNFYNRGGWSNFLAPVRQVNVPNFLRTHPATTERIARLRKQARQFKNIQQISVQHPPLLFQTTPPVWGKF